MIIRPETACPICERDSAGTLVSPTLSPASTERSVPSPWSTRWGAQKRCDVLDANIFIYGLTAKSAQCKSFLDRCSKEEVSGITLFEVANEATHKFMLAEARQKGLFTREENAAKFLSKRPDQVEALTDYWVNTARLFTLNILFLATEQDIVEGAQTERVNAGLLTNDSIIAAAMREYGISKIATNHRQFETVSGISVFSPTDVVVGLRVPKFAPRFWARTWWTRDPAFRRFRRPWVEHPLVIPDLRLFLLKAAASTAYERECSTRFRRRH
jgi:predicted nucleic acid-binding protein